ncbi:hypothetical protein CWB96_09625 [Pseudoalteromonas citrea]|uniref:Amine oxidase domain-containing protein n=1 Tax=Pseudoalteromonas citrea TaxID=43655 RepID=A0A5S3XRR0_9GAMM|nr:flavin monoamine oxidase family protein [Pseudoalteromonas citrea]TMP38841.1 hypothetical protein CWB97_21350 [Pseudoalteromonas citrea]TMP59369.1 hypothetical protein CWB96_09625 [Pseudoalteromonas citrea]
MKEIKRKDSFSKLVVTTCMSLILTACGNNNDTVIDTAPVPVTTIKSAIVVGAGLSGLTAAYELEQIGYQVTVIEAKDHIGGRVGTLNIGDQHGEIGGEFIDGETVHTHIHQYANQFGVELADTGYSGDTESGAYYVKGKLISYTEFDDSFDPSVVNDYYRFYDELDLLTAAIPDPDKPAELEQAIEYDLMTTQTWIDQLHLNPSAKLLAEQWVRGEFDEPSDLSLLHIVQYAKVYESVNEDDVEAFRFLNGGKAMVDAFADNITGPIILGQPVTQITQVENDISVTTANGDIHTSDVIVVTVPLGVLDKITFSPTLPDKLNEAAQALNYGSHSKVLLKYDTRFWLNQGLGGDTIVTGLPTGWTWETTERQGGEGGILITYTSGDYSQIQKHWSDEDIIDARLEEIELMYPNSSQYFVEASVHSWINDEWTQGGFLAYGPGQITKYWGVFQEPVGRIYFAGEHTDTRYLGFMEGAVRSGVRVSEQINELNL